MNKSRFILLIIATVFTFITLYLPQPLQPFFAEQYQISIASAGALTTMTMLPLAIAPIFYGYLLGNLHPSSLLKFALIALALTNIAFTMVHHFNALLLIRFMQGAFIPIILTAIISLLTQRSARTEATLSIYVAATIFGGFLGRFLSGSFDTYFAWQYAYYLTAIVLIAVVLLSPKPAKQSGGGYQRPQWRDFAYVLNNKRMLAILMIILFTMLSYIALINYLPFIIRQALPDASTMLTGLMYSGNIIGVAVSLSTQAIVKWVGTNLALFSAIVLSLLSQLLIFNAHISILFMALLVYSGGIFLIHNILIGLINRYSDISRHLTNSFYISFYYTGAVIGSYLPGLVYGNYGRSIFLALIIIITLFSFLSFIVLIRLPAKALSTTDTD